MRSVLAIALTFLLTGGCASQKRSYEIAVKNNTLSPITIGQVKDGTYDDMWASPEDLAIFHARAGDQLWGVPVAPGKTAKAGPVDGDFTASDNAWLRVYRGEPTFSELLATSRGNPNRLDVRLNPGKNYIVITEKNGKLDAEPTRARPSPTRN
jgi:hypothetical protein